MVLSSSWRGATSCSFLGEAVVWVDVSVTAAGAGGVSGAGRSQVALRWYGRCLVNQERTICR